MKSIRHLLLAVTLLFLTGLFLYVQKQSSELEITVKQMEIEKKRLDPDAYEVVLNTGTSMTQYGFEPGATKIFYNQKCQAGDFCVFTCLVEKCREPDEDEYLKKLISITNKDGVNCYWFEGNPKPWKKDGEWYESRDSRTYGCLSENEFRMEGIAKK